MYPVTPPGETNNVSNTAATVLRAQANALSYLAQLYESEPEVQDQFSQCLQKMYNSITANGKIIFSGMGKSFKIAEKLMATMNSLGIHAASLHPSEALHGDLGLIKSLDTLIIISASGNSPELQTLLDHLPRCQSVVCLTCTPGSGLSARANGVLIAYLPEQFKESNIYGLSAPTVSTTACLAVGDAVCISLCEMLVTDKRERQRVFGRNHPGGDIGAKYKHKDDKRLGVVGSVVSINTPLELTTELDILRSCFGKKWLICKNQQDDLLYSVEELADTISSGRDITTVKSYILGSLPTVAVGSQRLHPVDEPVLVYDGSTLIGVVGK